MSEQYIPLGLTREEYIDYLKPTCIREFVYSLVKTDCFKKIEIWSDQRFYGSDIIKERIETNRYICTVTVKHPSQFHHGKIILSEKALAKLKFEANTYVYSVFKGDPPTKEISFLKFIRMISFGLLFTDPDNLTAKRINFETLMNDDYDKNAILETYISIGNFLTSNNEETNSSQLLWQYYKELHVASYEKLLKCESSDIVNSDPYITIDKLKKEGNCHILFWNSFLTCYASINFYPDIYHSYNTLRFLLATSTPTIGVGTTIVALTKLIAWLDYQPENYSLWLVVIDALHDFLYGSGRHYRKEWNYNRTTTKYKITEDICVPFDYYYEILNPLLESFFSKTQEMGFIYGYYGAIYAIYRFQTDFGKTCNFFKNASIIITKFEEKMECRIDCQGKKMVRYDNDDFEIVLTHNDILYEEFLKCMRLKNIMILASIRGNQILSNNTEEPV